MYVCTDQYIMSGWYGMVKISESSSLHSNSIPTIRLGGRGGGREEEEVVHTSLHYAVGCTLLVYYNYTCVGFELVAIL